MTQVPSPEELTAQARTNLHHRMQRYTTLVGGVAGVSTLALLAVSSIIPLAAGGFALPVITHWLAGLGSNALAAWLTEWANRAGTQALWDDPDESGLLAQLAEDLEHHLRDNKDLQDQVAQLFEVVNGIPVALAALTGQMTQQQALIDGLRHDLKQSHHIQGRLHRLITMTLEEQVGILRQDMAHLSREQAEWSAAILAEIRALREDRTHQQATEARSLTEYVQHHEWDVVAQFVIQQAREIPLEPFGIQYDAVIRTIDMILNHQPQVLSDIEALILLLAAGLPHLQSHDTLTDIDGQQWEALGIHLARHEAAPPSLSSVFSELGTEVILVARGRHGFALGDSEYSLRSIRRAIVRPQLLAALLHLAIRLTIDHLDSAPPEHLIAGSDERLWWWQHRYIRSLTVTSRQVQVHFLLPAGRTEQYYPIIVAAISQELAELIDHYAYILFSADIFLRYQHPTCEEGIVPPLPDEDWEQLRQWVTVRQARKAEDRLQQQMWQTQRLRDALLNADVNIAEALVESGDIPGAITLLSRVAAWFAHERDGYQAARYAQRAAQLAHQINDVSTAVDHVLLVADVYFHDTLSPELAQRDIQHGVDLATEVGDPVLLVRLSLAQAQIAFATLDDPHVREYLEEAQRYLTNIINTEERALLAYRIALLHARCAVVWEEWSTARHVLEEVLAAHPPTAHDICFDVLALLLAVLTEWHEAAAADRVYTVALALISDTDRRRLGLFHMHYATSLARRGELDIAYQTYQKAIHILDGVAEQYDLCILYQNMKSTLGRADNSFIQDLALYESTRIDLFHRTKGLNRGYRHEQKAAKSLVSAQPREVLRHLRLALYHYWADGAYFSLFGAYRLLSSLYSSHGYVVDALLAMIRTGETKRVKHLAEHITREADSQMVQTIITRLIEPSPAPHELPTVAHTLGILADVTPPPLLDSTLEYLIDLIRAPVQMMKQRFTRLESFHALANFVPQLNADQTNTIVNLALEIGQESHHWTVMEALIDLLNNCFIETHCRVDPTNYARVLAFAMAQIPNSMDGTHVERLIVHMGRTAPTDVRAAIIEHIKSSRSNDIHKLIDLAFLAVPVAEETIAPTITRIMEAINREPQVTVQDGREVTQWSFGGVSPGVLLHLTPLVPTQLHSTLVDGLLRAIINEHNDLGLRSAAATTLSELPVEFVENRADEVADYLLLCLEEELVTASYVASALASQRNVFSNFTMNLGAIETVQRTCLRGLGKLYRHVNQNRQDRVCQQIVQAGRHSHPELRQGAVMALEGLEGHPFPSRLLFTLVALLHDPDVQTCSWACAATAQLLERGMVSDYAEDLVERLCNLATSSSVDIRTGVAVAIGRLYQGNVVNETVQQTCGTLLDQLMEDVSHRVRRQAVAFRNNPL